MRLFGRDLVWLSSADRDAAVLHPGQFTQRPGLGKGHEALIDAGGSRKLIAWREPWVLGSTVHTLTLVCSSAPTEGQKANENPSPDLYGVLMFGQPGAEDYLTLDWINGTCIVLPSSNGSIIAAYPMPANGEGWQMRVGAFVSKGIRPAMGSINTARRTVRLDPLGAAGVSPRIALPSRAHTVSLFLQEPLGYGSAELLFSATGAEGTGTAANARARIIPGDASPIAIPNGTRSIRITNLSGAALNPVLVFGLAL